MAAISLLNPKAEFARAAQALAVNISAAKGIQEVMRTNLGPKGTMKMYAFILSRAYFVTLRIICIVFKEFQIKKLIGSYKLNKLRNMELKCINI